MISLSAPDSPLLAGPVEEEVVGYPHASAVLLDQVRIPFLGRVRRPAVLHLDDPEGLADRRQHELIRVPPQHAVGPTSWISMAKMDPQLAHHVRKIEALHDYVKMFEHTQKVANSGLDAILSLGWCIISTWIKPEYVDARGYMCVTDMSFRFAGERGVDGAEHDERVVEAEGHRDDWVRPVLERQGGLVQADEAPRPQDTGLDIETSTYARGGGMPLPHDQITSITISNGCWYDKKGEDVCICIYTFGYVREVDLGEGHRPVFVRTRSSEYAVHLAWAALDKLGYHFVNVHNAFNFDLKHMAACAAELGQASRLLEKKRLGNFWSGVFMTLTRGCMFVDSMCTAMKTSRPGPVVLIRTRSCIQEAIADNVGMMVFCVQQSVCMASGMCLDLSATSGPDERRIEGGLALDPIPGVYKGVRLLPHGQEPHETGLDLPEGCGGMPIGDLLVNDAPMVMRTKDVYLGIVRGGPVILSAVIRKFISERKATRANGD
ncbi:hypothetical protein DL767_011212 [Monosporascus sp. MG133]|nr:hypothetical protein DL767_011212 [Monosporascus sp. MG133]